MPNVRSLSSLALIASLAAAGLVAAPAAAEPTAAAPQDAAAEAALANERQPLPGVLTGGLRPDADVEAAIHALAAEGVRIYVDLRSPEEGLDAARAAAEAAGLVYISIPVASEGDLDLATVRELDSVLADPARGPAAIACASGNRSGALLALRAFWLEGKPAGEALELGRVAGLTRFEPQVRTLLGLPPAPPADPAPAAGAGPDPAHDH